ncbi:MAG: GNAT family N-acetyltransferase [Fimbriimonadaceae bacterium]|nr:GNAT family N-acetyltransferase [Chthonomonadaceae bacterium]MCO5296056.1 GNAT family N-acetyltransferase [Fimbriimonadaceae bacterium]
MATRILIRPQHSEEAPRLNETIGQAAWLSAFRHLLPVEAMESHFAGHLDVTCDYWTQRGERLDRFVAELDGEAVGFIGLGTYAGGEGEVRSLYVSPSRQGQGVGQALWEHAIAIFRKRGISAVNVWTLAGANSCRFYEAMGCEPIGTGTLFLGPHSATCVHYRLELPSTEAAQ